MDDRTLQLILAFAQLDTSPQITAILMEMAQLDKRWVRYMAGPVILHQSPWAETLPAWVIPAIYADRVEQIAQEIHAGTVGELATFLEVLAYLYPATMDAPFSYEWTQVYLYCGQAALTKHGKIPDGLTFAQLVLKEDHPLELSTYIREQFLLPLQMQLRRKVVQAAAAKRIAKPPQLRSASLGADETDADEEEQVSILYRPQQMSLFEVGE